ncbi:golgin [Holotrichia oblita]|uniref:Golgin n=1 Tax=Holotrichia oblita TaxID=644536 RepID=A0ACB9SRB7_HOLOL|nr:golgin [Holotrichia oblita]
MFKKLKDKIAEDLKFSPQRLTQGNNEKTQSNNTNSNNDENFFSITEDDAPASTSSLGDEFTDVSLHASTPMESRTRKLSNSSFASDISFLPRYEPSGNLYHMQSDVDASASEMEDNVSTSSQLGHISKEQVYAAFQKAQMRYHKYRGRYTDLANHYKILEKENAKIRTILVDTQDKAIRRVNELKEQCGLEQKAKAHLENALRVELDEKQIKIDTLQTKIKLLQTSDRSEQLIDVSDNSRSTSNSSLSENQELTKYLNDARVEIENLNGRLQEMKANAIIFNSKESDYKSKITNLEKLLSERNGEINQFVEREKENNLKLAQSKMELHAEIHNKDLEIANLKRELDKTDKSKGGNVKLENLQTQNTKLIDKVENLNQKCSNYESELIKLEQYKIEIGNLNEIMLNLKKMNEELVQKNLKTESELKDSYELTVKQLKDILDDVRVKYDEINQENETLKGELVDFNRSKEIIDKLKSEKQELESKLIQFDEIQIELNGKLEKQENYYKETIDKIRDDAKQSLLTLETKIKEKLGSEFDEKESKIKQEFEAKLEKLLSNSQDAKTIEVDLMQAQDSLKKVEEENDRLKSDISEFKIKYTDLENNHLDLINENNKIRKDYSVLEKDCGSRKDTIDSLEGISNLFGMKWLNYMKNAIRVSMRLLLYEEVSIKQQNENCQFQDAKRDLEKEISQLNEEVKACHKIRENLVLETNAKLQENLNKVKESHLQEISKLNKELKHFKQDLNKAIENLTQTNEEKACLEQENENLQGYNLKLENTIKDMQGKLEDTNKEKISVETALNLMRIEVNDLKQYETQYKNVLDENHNLKGEISKIEELRLKLNDLESIDKEFKIISNENKRLKQDLFDSKVSNEKLKDVESENLKLIDNITELQARINSTLVENQNLKGELTRYQQIETRYNEINREIPELQAKFRQIQEENAELLERNRQLTGDYKQILHENERSSNEIAELKLRFEQVENDRNKFDDIERNYQGEIDGLKHELNEHKTELNRIQSEKFSLEKLQSSTLESNENQTSSLKNKIKQLQDEKSDYESLFNEYKQMKTDVNNVTQLYDKCLKEKKDIEAQLHELERHYNEMLHEKQLLKDEIQELKISPLNFADKPQKLDDLNSLKHNINEENYAKEIESLREKLEQYKSIDKANRTSIEFYENELQKLKVKNEKLTRKLDDTLVTLPVLSGGNDFGDSNAKLEYLRNILFNYMIGRESLVLAKVITAVCKFDKDQTELIMQKEQQRQTLIGQLFGS